MFTFWRAVVILGFSRVDFQLRRAVTKEQNDQGCCHQSYCTPHGCVTPTHFVRCYSFRGDVQHVSSDVKKNDERNK